MTLSNEYVVSVQLSTPRTIAAVHTRLRLGAVSSSFRQYLDQVYAAARNGHVALDGQNIFVYNAASDQQVDVAFGVGVTAPFDVVGNVRPTELPIGEVATTTHWGNYGKLGSAHKAIVEWCQTNGRRLAGTSWEVYGHWTDDEAKLRTDLYYLLEPGDLRETGSDRADWRTE
jgi:effector-binding domain-containing protein